MAKNQQNKPIWGELDTRFREPLLAYFRRRVNDPTEAEDLTQEVFVRLTRQADEPQSNVQGYVFVTAANLLRDRARIRQTHQANAHSSLDDPRAATLRELTEERDPERVLLAKDTLREFISGLDSLSERTRDIFVLARLEHMHQRDIAKLFGISVSAVEKHVMKALSHLGSRLVR